MPSSKGPKFFPRKSSLQFLCIFIIITALIFVFLAILRTLLGQNCNSTEPRSISVVWQKGESNDNGVSGKNSVSDDSLLVNGNVKRYKVMGFVGIFTGFGSFARRRALRRTWLPSGPDGLQRLEEATGLAFRFIIGRTSAQWKMSILKKEVAQHDDFILLDIEEEYSKLPHKTLVLIIVSLYFRVIQLRFAHHGFLFRLAFFKAAYALFDSEFYVKADDDIYLRPDRLSLLLAKERSNPQTYIGCMKKGSVFTDPKLKWYEPLSELLGKEYFLHAYGPIYALSAKVVRSLVAIRNDSFRMFSNEDVTIGSWMLAMNVNHENNLELCSPKCTSTSIAVWDIPRCSGLCRPETKMVELHQKEECWGSPNVAE